MCRFVDGLLWTSLKFCFYCTRGWLSSGVKLQLVIHFNEQETILRTYKTFNGDRNSVVFSEYKEEATDAYVLISDFFNLRRRPGIIGAVL